MKGKKLYRSRENAMLAGVCGREQAEGLLAGRGYRNFRVRLRPWGALLQFDDSQHADAERDMENIRGLLGGMFHELRLDPKPRANGD